MTKVDKKHMRKRYEDDPEFQKFVKEVIAISHLPPEHLKAGFEHLEKDFNFEDDKAQSFKIEFLNYISTYWINGCYPRRVWMSYYRGEDLTNNNQEGFNSKINKKLKQINPSPGLLLLFVYKQLMAAEVKALKLTGGAPKPRKEIKQKMKAKSRMRMKRNLRDDLNKEGVNKQEIINEFLAAMSHNVVSSSMSNRKACESNIKSKDSNEVIDDNEDDNNISNWNIHEDSNIMDITNDGVDPYASRMVGVSKNRHDKEDERKKIWWVNEKCTFCGKGFNGMSKNILQCHSCDRYTHGRKPCSSSSSGTNTFSCSKCKTHEPHAKQTQEIEDNHNKFKCEICNFLFTRKQNLSRHMKTEHDTTKVSDGSMERIEVQKEIVIQK